MEHEFGNLTKQLSIAMGKMREELPDVMNGFSELAGAATKKDALDPKTKELIALGIAVSTRCDGCIGFHTKTLLKLKVSRKEFMETLGMAIYMGGGPSVMYAARAVQAYEEFSNQKEIS